ncbi:hypothetical protein BsWGS_28266 [Bradybaena similaris]
MDYFYENVDETRTSLNHECNGTLTESIHSIEISYNEIFNDFSHICAFYVENATYFHLMFFQKPTELNENFYNVTGLINILVFDHDPSNGSIPVEELKEFEVNRVAVVPGNRIWLLIRLNIDGSATEDFDDIHWSVAYVAVVNDTLPVCDSSGLEETENGVYIVRNNTFGSVADLECSEGFVLDFSTRFAMCSVVDNVLRWIPGTSLCSSVCEHPPNVAHANMYPRMDTRFTMDNSRAGGLARYFTEAGVGQPAGDTSRSSSLTTDDVQGEFNTDRNNGSSAENHSRSSNNTSVRISSSRTNATQRRTGIFRNTNWNTTLARTNRLRTSERTTINGTLRTNVTVHYTCNEPYILSGLDRIHCGLDPTGIPRWLDLPPSCVIPDCSQTINLTAHSGAIVNPSYPETTLTGGSQICRWEISAADDINILVSPIYVHLPDVPGVEVSVLDSGAARASQLLHLTNQSHLQNATSETSKVTVIYHGPSQNTTGYRGFYIQYFMQPREGRIGSSYEHVDVIVKTTDSPAPVLKEPGNPSNASSQTSPAAHRESSSADSHTDLTTQTDNRQDLLKSSTSDTTATSEIITTQNGEPHIMHTSLQPTSQGTDEIANHTWEVPVNSTSQQTGKICNITTLPVPVSAQNDNSSALTNDTDDSSDAWKIAIGVMVPLCALVLVPICVFVYFRRKYPVRMMIGRDVAKVCNPQYPRPADHPALVRADASEFFSKRQSAISSEESAPEKVYVVFENLGFSGDDDDDEGQEHKFMETKNWLVNETKRVLETNPASMVELHSESEITEIATLPGNAEYELEKAEKQNKNVSGARSVVPCRHNSEHKLAETDTSDSNSGIFISSHDHHGDDQHSGSDTTPPNGARNASVTDEDSGRSSPSSYKSESIHIDSDITRKISEEDEEEEESGFMKTSMILFQQPTFEEVWAQVKARSRSLTLDRPLVDIKPRSWTVDPGKSARKMSLHDDLTASERFRLLSSSARSDKQSETSCSLNLNSTNIPETSASLSEQENDSDLESSQEKCSQEREPVNSASSREAGSNMSASGARFGYDNEGYNRSDENHTELTDCVDNSAHTDKLINDSSNDCTDNLDANTSRQMTDAEPATTDTDVDVIHSRKLSGSNKFSAENTSSLDKSGFSNEETTFPKASDTQVDEGTRRVSKEEQIKQHYSLENVERLTLVENPQDIEGHVPGPDDHFVSVVITNVTGDSETATTRDNSNLLNRINPEQNTPKIEMVSTDEDTDSHDVATSFSIISNDVDDINDFTQNLNDSSDDESTGVKVTDSDISDILDNSSGETEPEDNGDELADVRMENLSSSNPETTIILREDVENNPDTVTTLRQDGENNDIDV